MIRLHPFPGYQHVFIDDNGNYFMCKKMVRGAHGLYPDLQSLVGIPSVDSKVISDYEVVEESENEYLSKY